MTDPAPPISRFPVPDPETLPEDIRKVVDTNAAKAGFTPNVFLAYGYKPEHFRAFFHYYDVLMKGPSELSRAEREMIVLAVSRVNACTYCTVAHGAALRILSKNPVLADQISANYRVADITPRQRAMLDFAVKMTNQSWAIEEAYRERLRRAAFSDRDIWDIAAVAGFFNMSNRVASATDMRPNAEYHGQGR
jgi:uncharacterized peroxidase-related enzyme